MALTLRTQKGSPLTWEEGDDNLTYLSQSISSSVNGVAKFFPVFGTANSVTSSLVYQSGSGAYYDTIVTFIAGISGSSANFTGNAYANAFYQNSSEKLKTNIEPFIKSGLEILENVQVSTFNYKNNLEDTHIGFIAERTPSELSTKDQNTMDIPSTVGVLIKAVQELSARVKELEAK